MPGVGIVCYYKLLFIFMFMQLTENYYLEDFTSVPNSMVPTKVLINLHLLAKYVQVMRDTFQFEIYIVKGYTPKPSTDPNRTYRLDYHHLGMAADLRCNVWNTAKLAYEIEELIIDGKILKGGIGMLMSHVHYDFRGVMEYWQEGGERNGAENQLTIF